MAAPHPERDSAGTPTIAAARLPLPEPLGHAARVRLAVEILVAYATARRALRHAPIDAVIAELRSRTPVNMQLETEPLAEARRLGRAVSRLLKYVPGDTRCLARSLVLTSLLSRRGVEAKLVIGARTAPEFLAHAWVEHAGQPVLDPGEESFGRMVEL